MRIKESVQFVAIQTTLRAGFSGTNLKSAFSSQSAKSVRLHLMYLLTENT